MTKMIDLQDLLSDERTAPVTFGSLKFDVTYRPAAVTDDVVDSFSVNETTEMVLIDALDGYQGDWDDSAELARYLKSKLRLASSGQGRQSMLNFLASVLSSTGISNQGEPVEPTVEEIQRFIPLPVRTAIFDAISRDMYSPEKNLSSGKVRTPRRKR